jgi:16S rRNA (guanine966-N2)-methyltransferase
MLRVIAGEYGGRRLRSPSGLHTRPTADRVRQALFNILPPPPPGSIVVDLYAGSGALGIEALSRGAAAAVFVDDDATACRVLRDNLRTLGLSGRATVIELRVDRVLPRLLLPAARRLYPPPPYHYVFADPPYKDVATVMPPLLRLFAEHAATLLGPDGVLVLQHDRRENLSAPAPLACVDFRRYGDTSLSFFAAPAADRLSPDSQPGDPP